MNKVFAIAFLVFLTPPIIAQDLVATLIDASIVADSGLFFDGTQYNEATNPDGNYRFANRITPHGNRIDVVNGYAFVTWYKGGLENRNLRLSRKN